MASAPAIIQGGMGIGVSGWRLARAVAVAGGLGVVSGVAVDALVARRLQRGDPGGQVRRALAAFPVPPIAQRVLRRYFVPGGIPPGQPFRPVPRLSRYARRASVELTVVANFVEVYLAKLDHAGAIGVNYLERIQLAAPAAGYGAMLAGVDHVLVGAGVPTGYPAMLAALAAGAPVDLPIRVAGMSAAERYTLHFDPGSLFGAAAPVLRRPRFLAVVSSAVLAERLAGDASSRPDGFVVEAPTAGGHVAPPRGRPRGVAGEPVYGPRDEVDLARLARLGVPYWLAGGQAGAGRLAAARAAGAAGVQVGTAFALCRESGIEPELRRYLVERALAGTLPVETMPNASPARFPFKVVRVPGTMSEEDVYAARPRLCDLGYFQAPVRRPGGRVGYRCPAEPLVTYARKGGDVADTRGPRCLCNSLMSTVGLGQHRRDGYVEPPMVTLGQDLGFVPALVTRSGTEFTAADVIDYLLDRETHPDVAFHQDRSDDGCR